jgi:hypothetical protein
MAEADAKDRDAAEELLNVFDGVTDGLGVAGAIRKENAIGLEIENVLGRSCGRDDPHVAMVVDEESQDILLDAKVVGYDTKLSRV